MLTSCRHHRSTELKSVCVSTPGELLISLESRHLRLTHIHRPCIKRLFLIRETDLTNTHGRGGSFFFLLSFLFSPFLLAFQLSVVLSVGVPQGSSGFMWSVPCCNRFLGHDWNIITILQCFFYPPPPRAEKMQNVHEHHREYGWTRDVSCYCWIRRIGKVGLFSKNPLCKEHYVTKATL